MTRRWKVGDRAYLLVTDGWGKDRYKKGDKVTITSVQPYGVFVQFDERDGQKMFFEKDNLERLKPSSTVKGETK